MYEYKAKIERVYDGDGVYYADVDLGFNIRMKRSIRLYGCDTPELRGDERDAGIIVRDFVRDLILGKTVRITTMKDSTGKYGRLMARIIIDEGDLTALLIKKKYAKPYFGAKKNKWTTRQLNSITKL